MYKGIKDTIVETSYELFKEKGYEQTTIMDICKKCGITKTTFYRYINSKEDLLAFFFNNISSEATSLLIEIANADHYYQQICCCFDVIVKQASKFGPELYSQLYIANLKENRGTFNMNGYFNNLVITLIEKGQASNEIRNKTNARDLYQACASLCFGYGIQWCLNRESDTFSEEFFKSLAIVLDVDTNKGL